MPVVKQGTDLEKESNLVRHAKSELALINMTEKSEEIDKLMYEGIMDIVRTFSEQGHSGFSGAWAVGALERLLQFEPLSPLTGEDSEWNDVGDGLWQNNRCGHVFKDKDHAWDGEGKIFRDENGSYTNKDSHVTITFPYTPTREYVDVGSETEDAEEE